MTISERVFEKITDIKMSQKEFSEKTGILQSTISEWKKKKTNPNSDKIMIICKVLNVTPEWLLSGVDSKRTGKKKQGDDWYVVDKKSELGFFIEQYNKMDSNTRSRILGYMQALSEINNNR